LALPANAAHAIDGSAVLLRAAPRAASWAAGWIASEFAPQLLNEVALNVAPTRPGRRFTANRSAQDDSLVLDNALRNCFGSDYASGVYHPVPAPSTGRFGSMLQTAGRRKRYTASTADISYGPHGRDNLLDIWRNPDLSANRRAPVLVVVPGGCWTISNKLGQGYPLMCRMVERGWVCVAINYRGSPKHPWPAHIVDVKRALAWVREHIADYGGDPDFIAIAGGSAGGHLSSLAALTANDSHWQPGFENADTSVNAAVSSYGIYDMARTHELHHLLRPYLEHFVFQARHRDNPALFETASPVHHAHAGAPPFFVLSGAGDPMVPRGQATTFCSAMRRAGADTLAQAELPDAHHGFDMVATVRCQVVVQAVADFLGIIYGRHVKQSRHAARTRHASAG
jgi:acetyl esterase/lipase